MENTLNIIQTKICGRCRSIKPTNEFGKDKCMHDGLYRICKKCRSKKNKEKYQLMKTTKANIRANHRARKSNEERLNDLKRACLLNIQKACSDIVDTQTIDDMEKKLAIMSLSLSQTMQTHKEEELQNDTQDMV